ncbi:MAG TPA: amidohydrolase family protein, partial [Methylomirabilota bacterium]|nr:amidohydrolase family protein [Methylomirabilota bacterium]
IVTPRGRFHGGLAVQGGRIVAVGADGSLPPAHRVIDAGDRYVLPGLIDAHVHMASEEDASIAEGLRANMPRETEGALYGGVTTFGHFVGMRNEPLQPNVRATIEHGDRWSHVDYFLHAIVSTEEHFDEQPALWALGVTSYKHFFNAYRTRPGEELSWLGGPSDAGMLYRSLRFCAERGHPGVVVVHCEDIDLIVHLEARVKAAGRRDLGAWSDARPNAAESTRVAMAIELARWAGAPLYVAHLSTAEAADLVAAARARGEPVWSEVTPHHLTHTGDMEEEIGCWGKVNPPLRAARDTERLWRAFHDGGITCLGSDHGTGGRTRAMKEKGGGQHNNIWGARSGNRGGLEHFLPVLMTSGVAAGRLSMEDVVRVGAENTARVFGLYPRKGVLAPGADADVVIVDPDLEATVDDAFYHCLCEVSVYRGQKFRGLAWTTIVRGRVMMETRQTVGTPGWGRHVPRGVA